MALIYGEDACGGIVLAGERHAGAEPVDRGFEREIIVRELVGVIGRHTGFTGTVRWDATKPDGQPRRALDTSRAREAFGFEAQTDFEDGIRGTVAWYEQNAARLGTPSGA